MFVVFFAMFACVVESCSKKNDTAPPYPSLDSLSGLKERAVFLYRVDSNVATSFSRFEVHSYFFKDSVDAAFKDGSGRPSYRIYRYVTDTLKAAPWAYQCTYYVVVTPERVETTEQTNLRFINIGAPVSIGTSWKGNAYLDSSQRAITTNSKYEDWDYQYTAINAGFRLPDGREYPRCTTVLQKLDTASDKGPKIFYTSWEFTETYSFGTGLVYKKCLLFAHQPAENNNSDYFEDGSYSMRMYLIEKK